jgi:hypothetical protein
VNGRGVDLAGGLVRRAGQARRLNGALAVLLVCPVASPVRSQPPDADDQPLFPAIDARPFRHAAECVLAGARPGVGAWAVADWLLHGVERADRLRSLQGPMSRRDGRTQLGAGTLWLNGFTTAPTGTLTGLAVLDAGHELGCWRLVNTEEVRPFPAALKEWVHDELTLSADPLEADAYTEILVMAYYTSPEAFRKAARRDLAYVHLFQEPAKYRGEVVHVEGRLKRLLRFDPPEAAVLAGVPDLYEGWIFDEIRGANPVCVVFTRLPPGVELNKPTEAHVAFDGYYFKKLRYRAANPTNQRQRYDAPLLIGNTLTLRPSPAESGEPAGEWGHALMAVFIAVVGGGIAFVAGLAWWFRRDDRRVRTRVRSAAAAELVLPEPEEARPDDYFGNGDGRPGQGSS